MKTPVILVSLLLLINIVSAQDFKISVTGTSTFHDWEMKSSKMACNANFSLYDDGTLAHLTMLNLIVPAESLKGDRTGMDNNAYRSLKTSQFTTITFIMINATVSPSGDSVECNGKLTIAGVTKDVTLGARVKINADKSISLQGSKELNMRDYDMDPPSFLGAFRTGEIVTVHYDMTFKQPH